MLFHSLEFFISFAVILVLRAILPKNYERTILLLGSYFFYAWWSVKFLGLLIISTLVDFYAGKYLGSTSNKLKRKLVLILSLAVNLGILFIFKYWIWASNLFGYDIAYTLVLPLGISFYTFQSMSYTLDVYLGKSKTEKSFLSFALYVSFFPQLVAGPIERSGTLLAQIKRGPKLINRFFSSGVSLFVFGLIKKVIFADHFGEYVSKIYSLHDYASSLELILASYAFALQIYCDFSGYTDMARGTARIMGYELHKNFDLPYFAHNIREFWQKWHITLSTWFRDYLYIPLGGNRLGEFRTYINILITMSIAGLWHGANLTFVFWGIWHGLMICACHLIHAHARFNSNTVLAQIFKIVLTFNLVVFGWIFFRSESLSQALAIIQKIFKLDLSIMRWEYAFTLMLICFLMMFLERYSPIVKVLSRDKLLNWISIWIGIFSIIIFGAVEKTDFIYFQF
jgi:D-alanyl-lipoteichoic acid acyltransferase DltB (MBOAT superfamily)